MTDDEEQRGRVLFEGLVDAGLISAANWNGLSSIETSQWCAVAERLISDDSEELADDKVDELRAELANACKTTFVRSADMLNIIDKWFT